MSFFGGAECSTGSNPLSGLLKHEQTDRSLHQSTFAPQAGPSSLRSRASPNQSHEEAERFFQSHTPVAGPAGGSGFAMDGLRRELEAVQRDPALTGDREWASQYNPAQSSLSPADVARMEEQFRHSNNLSAEYWRSQQHSPAFSAPASAAPSAYQQSLFAPAHSGGYSRMGMGGMGMGMGMGGMGMMGGGMYNANSQAPVAETSAKNKGRIVELDDADWEAQFARAGESVEAKEEDATKAEGMTNLLDGETKLDELTAEDAELMKSLEDTWANLQTTMNNASVSDSEMAAWEAQYGQFANINGASGLGDDMAEAGAPPIPWTKDNVDSFLGNDTPFPYSTENAYMSHPDPFVEGQRLLAEGAPLSEAGLAFEAACRMDETRVEAWRAAGETWAADEREVKGIRALEKAVGCGGPDAIAAWMSLAVAYVNEGQELRALATLERWLSLAYPEITSPEIASVGPWDQSNRIINLFLEAARGGPSARVAGQVAEAAPVDPDVQVGLGVLFYSNSEYERARDCFEAALSVRPDDFLLWNRLGATLANGGLPEEAISAYRKALDLRPTFTRATYNLGVSCLNIGCYQESAEHLLAALEGQTNQQGLGLKEADGGEDGSANLWHTLRRAFLCLDRHDLADLCQPGTDVNKFRAEGFEF
ncbi:peroxisomal biogenesis factor 5 [Pseudohyphozyma bogoriensis]|nr:peroxisomal biogenesis factor 5 [Pseudohyphozyma bogoriensis]